MASVAASRTAVGKIVSRVPGVVSRTDAIVRIAAAKGTVMPRAARLVGSAAAFAAAMSLAQPALCVEADVDPKRSSKDDEDEATGSSSRVTAASAVAGGGAAGPDDEIDFAALIPDFGTELGLGILAGFSSGYAVKKIGKLAALTVGLGFVALQVARHYGVLKPEHMPDLSKLDKAIKDSLDIDGDGKVTSKDINVIANRGFKMLSANVPAASGFGVAFLLGLNYG